MTSTKHVLRVGLVAGLLGLTTGVCAAAPLTYNVNQVIGLGSVVGTIQTNGVTGVLTGADITNWNLTLSGIGSTFAVSAANSVVQLVGSDLTATSTALYFNFSGTDAGYLLFQDGLFSGMHYTCDAATADTCFQGASVVPEAFDSPSAQNVSARGNQVIGTATISVPEPMAIAIFATGLFGLGLTRRTRRS